MLGQAQLALSQCPRVDMTQYVQRNDSRAATNRYPTLARVFETPCCIGSKSSRLLRSKTTRAAPTLRAMAQTRGQFQSMGSLSQRARLRLGPP